MQTGSRLGTGTKIERPRVRAHPVKVDAGRVQCRQQTACKVPHALGITSEDGRVFCARGVAFALPPRIARSRAQFFRCCCKTTRMAAIFRTPWRRAVPVCSPQGGRAAEALPTPCTCWFQPLARWGVGGRRRARPQLTSRCVVLARGCTLP